MDGTAVKELKTIIEQNNVIEIDGQKFAPRGYGIVRNVDRENAIELTTLKSLVSFVMENPQGLDLDGAMVVIQDDFTVKLLSKPCAVDRKRTTFAVAENPVNSFQFGRHYDSEAFSIALKTLFVDDDQARDLWETSSTIQIEEGVTFVDNGTSQRIIVQKGTSAASKDSKTIPTITLLKPYRIFPECEQVESPFLVRLKGDKDTGASVALYETDGGIWKVTAYEIIATKLKEYGLELPIYY